MNTTKSILLVEDNPDDEELTLLALREYKLANDIVVARDGEEALDYLFARGAHAGRDPRAMPQLVLLDINLPKLSGIDVLRAIRADERTRYVPVVMLTTSKEENDLVASYSGGANSYIVKPVDFAQFVEAVRQLEVYWLILNQPVR
ncbi:MAG: response regulator [Ectothiorhodospiraceae bacterium]|jgi:CheY-like chemotaxis protein|nr:response regulator [Ectothiorhodospiraceae bacterium]